MAGGATPSTLAGLALAPVVLADNLVGDRGQVWFTGSDTGALERLNSATGAVSTFDVGPPALLRRQRRRPARPLT